MQEIQLTLADTLADPEASKSSKGVLTALDDAARAFQEWQAACDRIDERWSRAQALVQQAWKDDDLDVFWASTEILKPAIYSRPPVPVVTARFSVRDPFLDQASEILERAIITTLAQAGIDDVMRGLRDDLVMAGRGVPWVRLDDDGDRPFVIVEDLDRTDFLHEPARKWSEVGWVARCAWMTQDEMRERFGNVQSGAGLYVWQAAAFAQRKNERTDGMTDGAKKAAVWEVWHKRDRRVYWVTDGVDVMLDEGEPPVDLATFWPCPKPVYGSLKRRTLIPIPDYARYATHLEQINDLTSRIYGLLDYIRAKGLIPAGGDIGAAVETAMKSNDDDAFLIPVPGSAFVSGSPGIQWIPIDQFATTIQTLIANRQQLMQDFYQLSGISDIMRGATDAQETLGAQQLKSQYGSIRVRDKVDALISCARDICSIVGEVIAEHFDAQDLQAIAMTKLPTDADIKKQIGNIKQQAKQALEHLSEQAREITAQQHVQAAMPQVRQDVPQIGQGSPQ